MDKRPLARGIGRAADGAQNKRNLWRRELGGEQMSRSAVFMPA